MKKLIFFPLVMQTHLLFAGGFSGGGPPPLLIDKDEFLQIMQPDLGLKKVEIPADDFRRARARLSVNTETYISVQGESVLVKEKLGGITDLAECRQIMPAK